MGPLKGILSLLQGLGKGAGSKIDEVVAAQKQGWKEMPKNIGIYVDELKREKAIVDEQMREMIKGASGQRGQGIGSISAYSRAGADLERQQNLIAKAIKLNEELIKVSGDELKIAQLIQENRSLDQLWNSIKQTATYGTGVGLGGGAGYLFGKRGEEEAVEEMEKATQTKPTFREKFESGQWGEDVGEFLIDIISPFPRQD